MEHIDLFRSWLLDSTYHPQLNSGNKSTVSVKPDNHVIQHDMKISILSYNGSKNIWPLVQKSQTFSEISLFD